jgi:hypothetical protein
MYREHLPFSKENPGEFLFQIQSLRRKDSWEFIRFFFFKLHHEKPRISVMILLLLRKAHSHCGLRQTQKQGFPTLPRIKLLWHCECSFSLFAAPWSPASPSGRDLPLPGVWVLVDSLYFLAFCSCQSTSPCAQGMLPTWPGAVQLCSLGQQFCDLLLPCALVLSRERKS